MMTINLFIHFRNGKNGFCPISHGWEKKNEDRKKESYKKGFSNNPFLPFQSIL